VALVRFIAIGWGFFAAIAGGYLLIAGLTDQLSEDGCRLQRLLQQPLFAHCPAVATQGLAAKSETGAAIAAGTLDESAREALLSEVAAEFDATDPTLLARLRTAASSENDDERLAAALMYERRYAEAAEAMNAAAETAAEASFEDPERRFLTERLRAAGAFASLSDRRRADFAFERAVELDLECLADAIHYEGRGVGPRARRAVGEVVINRMRDPRFPPTICEVVYEGAGQRTGCQFTFTCDGSLEADRPTTEEQRLAQRIASDVMFGGAAVLPLGVTHYHPDFVTPYWSAELEYVTQIDMWLFYRRPDAAD